MGTEHRMLARWLWPLALGACVWLGACDDDDDDDDLIDAPMQIDAGMGVDAMGADAMAMDGPADAPTSPVMMVDCTTVTPAETVVMDNLAFEPAEITVATGEVVMWTNEDGVPHTVTSGNPDDAEAGTLFDSGNIAPGESVCFMYGGVGDFEYFCELHPVMMQDGLVTVEASQ